MQEKLCPKCGIDKPLSDFNKDPRVKNGLRSWCKECLNKSSRKRIFNHPLGHLGYPAMLRAKRLGCIGFWSNNDWENLQKKYDNFCLCCGEKRPLQADHIVSLSKGGTNYITNIQPLCWECNNNKRRQVVDFRIIWDISIDVFINNAKQVCNDKNEVGKIKNKIDKIMNKMTSKAVKIAQNHAKSAILQNNT